MPRLRDDSYHCSAVCQPAVGHGEEPWGETESDFYHGLILYASVFVHVQRGIPMALGAEAGCAGPEQQGQPPIAKLVG